jgi:hypothetical protein
MAQGKTVNNVFMFVEVLRDSTALCKLLPFSVLLGDLHVEDQTIE